MPRTTPAVVALCFVMCALVLGRTAYAQTDSGVPTGLAERVGKSVATLAMMDRGEWRGNGTGFVVRSDGVLATNHHVVEHVEGELVAIFRDGSHRKVLGLLATDEKRDIALVRIAGDGYAELPLAPSEAVQVGGPVMLVGSSAGLEQSLGMGVISAIRPNGFSEEWQRSHIKHKEPVAGGPIVQHTASSAPGSSGSPLVDLEGRVVAVHHSALTDSPIYFGAHVDSLRALIARTNFNASPQRIGADVRRNLLISAGVIAAIGAALALDYLLRRRGSRGRKPPKPRRAAPPS